MAAISVDATSAPPVPAAPLRTRLRRWPHLIAGIVLAVPTLGFEGLWFLIFGYCGTYGDVGPVLGLLVVTLPVVLPGTGALLDRRHGRRRPDGRPPSILVAILTMAAITILHLLLFYLMLLAAEATSSGEC